MKAFSNIFLIKTYDHQNTGIPPFPKFVLHPFTFMKDEHLCLFSLTQGNLKRIFSLFRKKKKGKKVKIHSSLVLLCVIIEAAGSRVAPPSFFPRNYTQRLRTSGEALNCVCEHLCCISIDFLHPVARCVPRY